MQRSQSAISRENKTKQYTIREKRKVIADNNEITEIMHSTRDVFHTRRCASASANR